MNLEIPIMPAVKSLKIPATIMNITINSIINPIAIVLEIVIPVYISAPTMTTFNIVATASPAMQDRGRSFKGFKKVNSPKTIKNTHVKMFAESLLLTE